MRRFLPSLLLVSAAAHLVAEEALPSSVESKLEEAKPAPRLIEPMVETPATPWLGVHVGKLEAAMRAHAPDVPDGVGFLVTLVDEEGPAKAAGVKAYDVLWKLDDQLLVNEAQLGTLLGMRAVGDRVELALIRTGKRLSLELELTKMPNRGEDAAITPMELVLAPSGVPELPKTIVFPQKKTAEVSRKDGSMAKLWYQDDEPQVQITDADGSSVYEGPVRVNGKLAVPDEWRCPVGALLRSLYQAERSDWSPRRPRPRVVVRPESKGR